MTFVSTIYLTHNPGTTIALTFYMGHSYSITVLQHLFIGACEGVCVRAESCEREWKTRDRLPLPSHPYGV